MQPSLKFSFHLLLLLFCILLGSMLCNFIVLLIQSTVTKYLQWTRYQPLMVDLAIGWVHISDRWADKESSGTVVSWTVGPLNLYVEVLISSSLRILIYLRWGLLRVAVRLYGWPLIQYNWRTDKKGKIKMQITEVKGQPAEDTERKWLSGIQGQRS